LCEAKHKNNIEIKKSCGVNEIPLLPMQKQMWMFNKTDRGNQYNVPIILSLDGNITKEKLIYCFRKIAVRHEVFRTTISDQNNIAIQKIHANLDSNTLKIIDLIKYKFPLDLALKTIKEDIDKLIFKKDDFLFRVKLFLLAENKFILYLNINHCIFDDWSLKILYKDFESLYNKKGLSKLPVKYKDYSISHLEYTKEKYESGLKFWKKSLLGIDYTLNLMTDYAPNKKDNGEGKKYFFTINSIMTENLKVYAKENNTTLFIFFLSALYILLKNYSQQTRFCIGTVFANRDQSITKDLVGCFINTVAIPISSGFNITFYKLMKDIEKIVLQAHKFQFIPFSEVVDVINPYREEGKTPIFQVMLNMLNPDRPKLNLKGVNTKNLYIEHNVSVFDLSFIIEAIDDEIKMSIQYKTSLFKEKSIIRMGTHFTNILKEVLNNNFQDISHINLLSLDEYKLVTDTFAKGKKNNLYPKDMDIIEIFEEIVFCQPEKIAIQFGKINLTYKDLLDKTHILSRYLKSLDLPIESIIGIYMEKSPSVIISMLSILKAGYAYLPLDIEYPADRIKYIIHDSSLKVVITTDKLVHKLNSFNLNLLITDLNFNNINFFKTSNVKLQLGKHNSRFNSFRVTKLAYVIYTSGSTGKPKGVMAEHRGVVRLVKNTNYININGNDIFALFSSLSFDAATFEIWGALLNGAKLIIPIKSKLSLYDIANIIEKNFVTIIFLTSILFKLVVGRYCNKLSSLKSLLSGGEVVDFNNEVKYFLNANKASYFIHVYGPTENTTFTSYYAIKEKFENYSRIPIGIPIANTSIYILDDYLKPAPIGVPGTIYTSGDGLSRGYINNLALTSEKFISNPIENSFHSFLYNTGDTARWMSDGNIEFIGRSDNQIKIRGFRVEIEEIEKLINSNFNIRESVVISQGLGEDKQLVAYYTVKDTSQFEETTEIVIRESLKRELPQYMLPSYFIQVSKIPFTPNGKIDKQKLIASYHCPVKKKHIPAENELQKKLVSIWEKILKTKPIGINDNFFDLGGSSIKNILIIDVLKKNGIYLDVQDIFTYETISELSTHINNYDLSINNYVNLSVNKRTYINEAILTPSQRFIFSLNGKDINKSNVGMIFYLSKKIDFTTLKSALEKLINHHDVLRLKFKSTASGWKPIYDIFLINDCLNVVTFVTNNKKSILKKIDYIKDELNNKFDIENKPLISICLLQLPNSSSNNILFVSMHHLITDAFSWKIFIEDLSSCLDNPNLVLQNKSDSYNFWAHRLNNISNSIMMKDQQDFWLSIITQTNEVESLLESNNQHSSHKEEGIVLSKEVTRYIKDISKKTRTKIDELLLAILYLSYKQWTKKNVMSILLLNNGRNAPFHDLSIVRTMGLFTIYYPVIFNNFFTVENFIKSLTDIKNTLRKISFDGMGYCLLRYSAENFFSEITLLQPDITFNYMGDFGSRKISNLLTRIDDITNRNITRELTYDGLSIVGMEFDGEINIVFGTSAKFKKSRTINGLTESFKKNVELITNQLKSLEATSISDINPSLFISLKSGSQKSENNTHPPVIFIPGQNGTCVTFRQIVKRFKLPMSVYGVQTYGLNEQESPFSTIEVMAEHNIKLLKMHYSKGPYIFIGYSYGGTVAFEMAYQLKNLFDDDAMVILIDAPPHQSLNIASPLNYIDNAINYLNRSFGLNIPIKLILLDLEKVRNIPSARYAANINTFILQIIRNYVNNENSSMLNNLLLLYHAQITATYSFVDKSIQEMTILLAKELISEGDISNAMRERITEWENYVNGTIKYIHVPGDHFSLFNDPNVEIVSKVLQDRILSFIEDSSFAIS
jgi:amino acid adenylation domain-containing protein/non-ribosomal peptide synthase protein (TIGR01720 family)